MAGRSNQNNIRYIELGPYPLYLGIAFTEKAFLKEMKRLGIVDPPEFVLSGADATMHSFTRNKHNTVCIIAINAAHALKQKRTHAQIVGLITHECVHVWQECKAQMREENPGREIEAYFIQSITQSCVFLFNEFKGGR